MNSEIRLNHLRQLEAVGINAYPAEPPTISHSCRDVISNFDQLQGVDVCIAGRIMSKRDHGRTVFYDVEDSTDKIQLLHKQGDSPNSDFVLAQANFDTGDIISATGEVMKTAARDQVTIECSRLTMLSKALQTPPSERFGITDPEISRRQRYLELMSNPNARDRFRMRARMVQLMREEFLGYGFLEVETPVLDNIYGGAFARPFTTHLNALGQDMFLRVANELYLKRLVCGNMGPVFEFSRDFRNEGMDRFHNPEFTAVELYKPYSDYFWMMQMTEGIFERIAVDLHGTTKIDFGDHEIDFKAPWKRLTVYEGLQQTLGIDPHSISDSELRERAKDEGISSRYNRRGDILLALFEKHFDGTFIQPTFVMDYPRETSPLAKQHRLDSSLAERFECLIGGVEVMNCYTESNDPRYQRASFMAEQLRKQSGYDEAMPVDEDFLTAMEYGFPPMGGIGIGVDRMAMFLTNTAHIQDIILFPQVKNRL